MERRELFKGREYQIISGSRICNFQSICVWSSVRLNWVEPLDTEKQNLYSFLNPERVTGLTLDATLISKGSWGTLIQYSRYCT